MNAAVSIAARDEARPIRAAGNGAVPALLRAEALVELALAVAAYRYLGGSWPMFAILFLAPDFSMAGYLINPRVGAHAYNLGHTYVAPALLFLVGHLIAAPLTSSLALIWAAHIGFDRLLGYGLKYPAGFRATHLGYVGAR
jgi:hypothetical protein